MRALGLTFNLISPRLQRVSTHSALNYQTPAEFSQPAAVYNKSMAAKKKEANCGIYSQCWEKPRQQRSPSHAMRMVSVLVRSQHSQGNTEAGLLPIGPCRTGVLLTLNSSVVLQKVIAFSRVAVHTEKRGAISSREILKSSQIYARDDSVPRTIPIQSLSIGQSNGTYQTGTGRGTSSYSGCGEFSAPKTLAA